MKKLYNLNGQMGEINITLEEIVFRKASIEDLDNIVEVFQYAIEKMNREGIPQWDEIYPEKEILRSDIEKNEMYIGMIGKDIATVFVLNQECDEQYEGGEWNYPSASYRVLHRLCVNPVYQNCGIAKKSMQFLEQELVNQKVECLRLDAFSKNPYALKLYERLGYIKVGEANWRKGMFYLMEKKF